MKGINKDCIRCKKVFYVPYWRIKRGGGKYCSMECTKTGKLVNCKECKEKFYVSFWELKSNRKYCSIKCADKNMIGGNPPLMRGNNHPNWKGDKVGYWALHSWVYRNWGKPKKCEKCNRKEKLEWANITGIYSREKEDWMQLCKYCHRKIDAINPKNPDQKDYIKRYAT